MKIKQFFEQLDKYYKGMTSDEVPSLVLCMKYYCQAKSFSFEIYKGEKTAHGSFTNMLSGAVFESEVYSFWNNQDTMQQIIDDIKKEMDKIEQEEINAL